ncbi:hypothetical protein [Thalassospira povalilytica]|uniref:hypothetical protein n=1 Tax=Thalassospira povalilytica TaxID=732237 RepID=UPI001D190144|nr:hypothetical protein [Thalassospira povalilytica]MCC4240359.1 hypothetical protein [Thalassospira povalilytica]
MSKSSNPWMKFYPTDWRADPALRVCSLAARGLWVEMLCIMHEATPRGYLTIKGRAVTDAQLAALSGASIDDITKLIGELEDMGVFSRDGKGCIYSRRIIRDEKKSRIAQKNGKSGGNPKLSSHGKQTQNPASVNPPDKGGDKGQDKTQKPEARSQIPEGKEKASPKSSAEKRGSRIPDDWLPSEPGQQYAASLGMTPQEIRHERDKFYDFWIAKPGKDGRKLDWDATWRNWIRRSVDNRTNHGTRRPRANQSGLDGVLEAAAEYHSGYHS